MPNKKNEEKEHEKEKSHSTNLSNRKNEEIIKKGNRAKYYIITGECLKCLLMSAQTQKGKFIRNYEEFKRWGVNHPPPKYTLF